MQTVCRRLYNYHGPPCIPFWGGGVSHKLLAVKYSVALGGPVIANFEDHASALTSRGERPWSSSVP